MIKSFFWSKRWAVWAWGGATALLASIYAQVYMSVLFNRWYGEFYTMMQKIHLHTVNEFYDSLWYFVTIALIYTGLATLTGYFTRLYSFRWREAMTFYYIPLWRISSAKIEGASQRIQQDTERFSRIVEGLGLQVVRAIMTLIAFLPLLWGMSEGMDVPLFGTASGNLVWCALTISIGGMVISWFVGIKLPGLEYNNQVVEAAYRKELVKGEDNKIFATLSELTKLFLGLKINYHRLFLHYGYFDLWVHTFDQSLVILPYLIAGPAMFKGLITLGIVVQIANAFGKVHESFSLFIHNWTVVTELRSIWKRLHEFQHAIKPV